MANLNVWVAVPYEYEIPDEEHQRVLDAIHNGDKIAIRDFVLGIEQAFGARLFDEAQITGIYDEDGNALGVG